jgi:hypothetical protein
MEPIHVIVATGISPMSKPMGKPKGAKFIRSRSPATGVIRKRGQSIMPAPILSMMFNVKTVIKISTICPHGKGKKSGSFRNAQPATLMMGMRKVSTVNRSWQGIQILLLAVTAMVFTRFLF